MFSKFSKVFAFNGVLGGACQAQKLTPYANAKCFNVAWLFPSYSLEK